MNIHEQAQQLAALADQVPQGPAQAITNELENLRQQVAEILGDTSSAQEIHGAIGQAVQQLGDVNAMLEQVRVVIVEKANYHQQG